MAQKPPANPQEWFMQLLIAAMMDAAIEKKMTQFQTTICPDGKEPKIVRVIIVPEEMEHKRPDGKPFGS
jgi:hypothetical protein